MREAGEGEKRLAAFKKDLRATVVVQTFTTPESLAGFVNPSISRWLQGRSMAAMGDLLGAVERRSEEALRKKAEKTTK